MAPRIAVVGSYGVGLTMRLPRLPQSGETLIGDAFSAGHGGKGSNQAVAAARLGATVSLLTAVGDDQFGTDAHNLWASEGIDATRVITATAATMVGMILVEPGGTNRIVIAPGALDQLTTTHVADFEPVIAQSDILVTGLEIPLDVAQHALVLARRHGVRTLLNPAPARRPLPQDWWPLIDVLTPNQTEASALTGHDATSETADRCADTLRSFYQGTIVITLGADGCLIDDPTVGRQLIPGQPARTVVDTTGAGDAFTGALATALARGETLITAATYANQAAAHSVSIAEVIPSLPRPNELQPTIAKDGTDRHA